MKTAMDVLEFRERHSCEASDVLEFLRRLPADAVDLVFCSPPYEQARLYLENGENLNIARDTEEWVAWMVEVCTEARRVCKGLCAFVVEGQTRDYRYTCSPFLLTADLHRAGFALRKPPAYHRIGIPGSGGPDWLRNDWEPVVCFTKGGRLPWSDPTACGSVPKWVPGGAMSNRQTNGERVGRRTREEKFAMGAKSHTKRDAGTQANGDTMREQAYLPPNIANPGNVLKCSVGGGRMGHPIAHDNEAPFPLNLAEFFVQSFAPPDGIVCDPFSGSGTTAHAAFVHGRRFVGCDLRQSQVDLCAKRLSTVTPSMFGAAT